MEFSWSLCLFNAIGEWASARRQKVEREIMRRQIKKLTTGLVVTRAASDSFTIDGISVSQMREVSGLLRMAEEIGYGSPFTRVMAERLDVATGDQKEAPAAREVSR